MKRFLTLWTYMQTKREASSRHGGYENIKMGFVNKNESFPICASTRACA